MIFIKKGTKWLAAGLGAVVLICGGSFFYQKQHFNRNIEINGVKVGGMSVAEATQKLKTTKLNNNVYLGEKLLVKGSDSTNSTNAVSQEKVQEIFDKQFSLFPSGRSYDYQAKGDSDYSYRKNELRAAVKSELERLNVSRTAPKDAYAELKNGSVHVINAKKGNQYDVNKIMQEYDKQFSDNQIKLTTAYTQPISADSKQVQADKAKLEKLADQKVNYTVQNKTYTLAAKDVINSAKIVDGKYEYDAANLKKKIDDINDNQSTLDKNLKFKTTGGSEITLDKGTYGWALSPIKATKSITTAFEKGDSDLNAKSDIYGEGYTENGLGYNTTSNNGIGNSYVEVSISQQHVWVYKNGTQVASLNVVTGTNDGNYNTPTGLYYIMYKQTNTTLRGKNADNSAYASPVSRWAPFTLDGCGFHDANWRKNWSSTAYLNDGSHGCVNVRPSQINQIYDNVEQYEPVVIYS